MGANTTVGVDWIMQSAATTYRVYWSTTAGVTPSSGQMFEVTEPGFVHRRLSNGTPYFYVVTAVSGSEESEPSSEVTATPQGEWVLEEFGSGAFDDITTGARTPKVPIGERNHLLLFAEGYTTEHMPVFHDEDSHDGDRENDVDRWVDLVFSIEPYTTLRPAFVVWSLPRASNTTIRDAAPDTAFQVPVDVSGSFAATGNITSDGETATRTWAAIALHPFVPTDFSGGGFGSARTMTAAFMIFDPDRGRASVSGRATSLRNPADTDQRISSGFGVGHAHEFSHAFAALRDEYLENDNNAPNPSPTSNVTPSGVCSELPWSHLIAGAGFHDTAQLVGAFGRPAMGFHSELLCLMNGTHDNAEYYGGDGLLRVEDRFCNWCRELVAYRTLQRAGVLDGSTAFDTWAADYREAFFTRFGVSVPDVVPQTNDVRDPAAGMAVYEACTDMSESTVPQISAPLAPGHACVPPELEAMP